MADTIYALSSGRPPAGIAVIRISGSRSLEINSLFVSNSQKLRPRTAHMRSLRDPVTGDALDQALMLTFLAPATVTGEDMVEWHCHGGQAVVRAVLAALARAGEARPDLALRQAESGEFTRRAFENGRIDLNEAEGLADLLSAETESQRRAALLMAEGHFSRRLDAWRLELLRLSALAESLLDFSDEDDVAGDDAMHELRRGLEALGRDMARQLAAPRAERLRDGVRLVLAGPPNSGKSTLLNALVGHEAAIVSDIAGTTRDRIEVPVDMGGIAFVLTDTAGLAVQTEDAIERIGIDRARQAMDTCDILLWLGDAQDCPQCDASVIRIATQMDRSAWGMPDGADIAVSALKGSNMESLVALILSHAQSLLPVEGQVALHQRQRTGVADMYDAVNAALCEGDLLIIAEHLRTARLAMDRLVGSSGIEDMLGALFGRFCIGK
ncbi:MAG: tRNA uridine-5-carboxymethylaminomethyl(34) synthesis GTPase MnmE [Sphingobium sp.]|nr:tRNA uridine-5-carboxymethylaminomethyl(34) synthesis GTPase MnmE [Sphingobium sp.]MBP6111387.1 tRNA uridine-5-carboxymethylaminomethyl(34) synthesis GTPase MnmE [Sphingobium sp.]MBP8670868.1 tRNA uridine-5-carboxymethylaminomethyl(34) synthesis GTPase MnmE [Sphingobium sp.]MBP9156705.1 tRNA uridine-5-carboxymethylaminomethyl(34) synthesis GTPase MnmE [Sphingobium sp.]MCC6483123.1 tRNA uridine-5-carboxymethylaminomethyl(34) synthesis GTPase MnmE [Sphingomonadaceae bacterium]